MELHRQNIDLQFNTSCRRKEHVRKAKQCIEGQNSAENALSFDQVIYPDNSYDH